MYRAQMELSLFGKALVNLCEEMYARCHTASHPDLKILTTDTVRYIWEHAKHLARKCNAWFLTLSHPRHTVQVSNCNGTPLDSQLTLEVPELHEFPLSVSAINITMIRCSDAVQPEERLLSLPHFVKAWVDNVAYHVYKTLDVLKFDLLILYLKKQRAQAGVVMFCEAIERTSEFGFTDGGTTSGISTTYESRPPANGYRNDSFTGSCSTLSASSDASELS
ncbi:hypothetical protein K503DRAFT_776461 [Rhizopogon vinicolor AM-OR11-026]|uniref:Uncharacterized protein n=1 Tax=Rhizopogon vinicolor AM-OR11-026 TaxID=1314800 RepID=A0A1B7MJ74_9AGAM|nr:hypothetical protein K503DRAFT_776461 [Rhizopogon vinicolor AM-OR11-026]